MLASRNPTIPQPHCSRWKVDAGKRPYSNLDTMIQYLADGPDGLDGKNMTSLNLQPDICQAEFRNTFRHARRTAIPFCMHAHLLDSLRLHPPVMNGIQNLTGFWCKCLPRLLSIMPPGMANALA